MSRQDDLIIEHNNRIADKRIADLEAHLAARQDLINADLVLLNNQRERIDEMEKQLAAREQECERLKAELSLWREYRPYLRYQGMFPPEPAPNKG